MSSVSPDIIVTSFFVSYFDIFLEFKIKFGLNIQSNSIISEHSFIKKHILM
jgi:hypothetical protein